MQKQPFLISILLLAILISACSSAPTQSAPQPTLPLTTCQLSVPGASQTINAKCGKLAVYEDRAAASGRQIELNVAVIPAVSRSPAADPLFFIPGGPGEAATTAFPAIYGAFERINQKRDIVLVDQRGTGGSNPLRCLLGNEETIADEETDLPEALAACQAKLDANLKLYTTSIAMDDLDQVRAALGYDQINLYGGSYGTRAALVYLRQHPEHVRAVILDGLAPPNWILGPSVAGDAQRALDLLFDRCAADSACNEAFPDLKAHFQSLLDTVRNDPPTVSLIHPVTSETTEITFTLDYFANTIHTLSYAPETAALLPLLIHTSYSRGDFSLLAAQILETSDTLSGAISDGMRYSVVCAEDVPFYDDQPLSDGYMGSTMTDAFSEICDDWPRGDIPADFHDPVVSSAPVLILSGEADPVTPPANGELAAQTLSASLHIVTPGEGHINIYRGCVTELATTFIESGRIEGLDTACVQDIQPMPFFLNFSGPTP